MCYHILKETGKVTQRTTIRGLTMAEWESKTEKTARERFDSAIENLARMQSRFF
jgi:hypothetical protein